MRPALRLQALATMVKKILTDLRHAVVRELSPTRKGLVGRRAFEIGPALAFAFAQTDEGLLDAGLDWMIAHPNDLSDQLLTRRAGELLHPRVVARKMSAALVPLRQIVHAGEFWSALDSGPAALTAQAVPASAPQTPAPAARAK